MKRFLAAESVLLGALLPFIAAAYTSPGKPTGFVNDFAGVLSSTNRQTLETKLSGFKAESSNEVAIAIIPSLGGDTIENYAVELFKEWGIGGKANDNGVLVLVSTGDHEMRIEVGYGLEGALTDAVSASINQDIMVPAFRAGDYFKGLDGATDAIIAATKGEYTPVAPASASGVPRMNLDWIWVLFCIPVWLASILGRSKSWWAGGVIGGGIGVILGFIKGFLYWGVASVAILVPLGLLFDFFVSRGYAKGKATGSFPWWMGGRGFGGGSSGGGFGGGGFGGFGGGSSGGGGASSHW